MTFSKAYFISHPGRLSTLIVIFTVSLFINTLEAQDVREFRTIHFTSSHCSFPDTGRINGHFYDSVHYSNAEHYNDSSVLLIIPDQFQKTSTVDLVFWFHGWRNNVDTAAEFYKLSKQFVASKRNAILVLPETARDAPDSYGGKLEQPGMFKALVNDVMNELKKREVIPSQAMSSHILLAGHSGAFRVIAYILQNGQAPVQEVFLFDALYSQLDKYLNWIYQDQSNHFVHWFTNHGGGTDEMSDTMMVELKNHHIDFKLDGEGAVNSELIRNNRILFIHSLREHNVIINDPDNFKLLLENSFILQPYSKK